MRADVIVVGAGAAGLTAARKLAGQSRSVILVEARARIGGRMWSERVAGLPVAIEYGAEFIHGTPDETFEPVRAAGLAVRRMQGQTWWSGDGVLLPHEPCAEMQQILRAIDEYKGPDLSFADYLARFAAAASDAAREEATEYVEGFDAADIHKVSVHWLQAASQASERDHGDEVYRLPQGYSALADSVLELSVNLRLSAVVRRIVWRRGHVRVFTETDVFEATAAIVTVPASVLPAIGFDPPVGNISAARRIASGPVIRVTFVFRDAFWLKLAAGLGELRMLFSLDRDFPTWWTTNPVQSPVLTGWAAGPRAARLSELTRDEIVTSAIAALSRVLLCGRDLVASQIVSAHTHNWQTDPYALGAYSYVPAGAMEDLRALANPVQETLFFAGEASDLEGRNGLVHGAISTGLRAAGELLRSG